MGKDSYSGKEDWEGDWKEVKVENQLDSNGWPKVKAFYVDRSPYPCKGDNALRYDSIIKFLIEQEKNIALEKGYEEPRMVFLLQDKDYWPGTETDPEAQKRQELKQSQAHFFHGHKDMFIHWHRNYGGIKEMLQMRSDPSLPGSSFIQEHLNCSLPCCLESEDDPDISGSSGSSSTKRKAEEEEKHQSKFILMAKDSYSGKEDWEGSWKEVEVEDQLDSNGWSTVKGFYVDRTYPCLGPNALRYDRIVGFLIKKDKKFAAEKGYQEPRMVFLLQDKDYWPDTETDPEAQMRRELKQSQSPLVFPGHKDVFIHWHRHYGGVMQLVRMHNDPSLPGSSFVRKHSNCSMPCCHEHEDDPGISGSSGSSSRKRKAEEEEKEEEAREEDEKYQSNRNAEGGEKSIHGQHLWEQLASKNSR